MAACFLCPRACGADRQKGERGFCGQGGAMRVARAALHPYEEPAISGKRGSGTIFFSGCSLGCVFCQNRVISRSETGRIVSPRELGEIMLSLQAEGAHNINLVTPTHFADLIAEGLRSVKDRLQIPVIYNSSGYETIPTLRLLEGLVDVYLPDFKYASSSLASDYASAPDYPEVAEAAIAEMIRQTGSCRFDGDGMLQGGVLVRLLVLPGSRKDAMAVLDRLSRIASPDELRVSIMRQYTPRFAMDTPYQNLHRRITRFEYESVVEHALALGFDGYTQGAESASALYTPDFD